MMTRRSFVTLALSSLALASAAGCHRAERCATCGMKLDPASHFTSVLLVSGKEIPFDTPRCAFEGWRGRFASAEGARFREYYSQELRDAKDLRFVPSSDVVGPMGADLVPVDPAHAARFAREHHGGAPMSLDAVRARGVP